MESVGRGPTDPRARRSAGTSVARAGRRRGRRRGRRAVSDVVATIILLALTVTLFASIFAFVSSFPAPPAQNTNQFQASLVRSANGTYITGITILHLAGPTVPASVLVYFKSANYPNAPEFANPIPVGWGIGNASGWNLGQTWTWNFPTHTPDKLPDQITIYVVSPTQLYYSVILPGQLIQVGPTVVDSGTTPANPGIGQTFVVWASISGTVTAGSVYVNLGGVPGLSGTNQAMTLNSLGLWQYTVPSGGTTAAGTYFAFITAGGAGLNTTAAVTVTVASTVVSSASLSVSVVLVPQPPTLPGTSGYLAAVVTYTGSVSGAALTVTFWANQTPGGPWKTNSTQLAGPTGLTISGPTSVTVYSTTPSTLSAWLLNSTVVIRASATVAGVGSAQGSTTFGTANLIQGIVFSTSTSFTHNGATGGCKTTGSPLCPFLNVTVWDNWTATGAPASISVSGTVTANNSAGTKQYTYTIGATTVTSGSSTTVDPVGTKTRWAPTVAGPTYTLSVWLKVTNGGVVIGYIYDTFVVTVS